MAQALGVIGAMAAGTDKPVDPDAVDWAGIDSDAAVRIRRLLAERYAPATANKMLAAMRGVMRAARDGGLVDEARFQAVARLEALRDYRQLPSQALDDGQVRRVLAAVANLPTWPPPATKILAGVGWRDLAAVVVFLSAGPRRAEAIALTLADVDLRRRTLTIRSEVAERHRVLPLSEGARQVLAGWKKARKASAPGAPLLTPVSKSGRILDRHLSAQGLYDVVSSLGTRAGMSSLSTRDLRRSFLVRLLAADLPPEEIARRAGHLSWLTGPALEDLRSELHAKRRFSLELPRLDDLE